jgi:IS5 family transposase
MRSTWRPGAIIAVTLQGADEGDTTTIIETAIAAAEQVEDAQADVKAPQPLEEIIADKGYHSNQSMVDLEAVGIRSYMRSRTGGGATGRRSRRRRRRCIGIDDGYGDHADAD